MNITGATNVTRIYHQYFPDKIRSERELNNANIDTIGLLKDKDYTVDNSFAMESTQNIF